MQGQFDVAGVTETIGRDRFFPTIRAAVEAFVGAQEPPGAENAAPGQP